MSGTAMNGLTRLGRRLAGLVRKRELESDLDEELRFHVEMEAAQLRERGLAPDAARTEALRRFGGLEKVKEACRDERGLPWLEHLLQDLRYGIRTLVRTPGFTLVVVVTLALGIGANTALFSVVHGVLLRPLPYGEGGRLLSLRQHLPGIGAERTGFSVREIRDLRQGSRTLEEVAEFHGMAFTLLGDGEPVWVSTGVVSSEFFDVLGIEPLHGRTFRAGDDIPGAEPVLILGHGFWRRHFGADPDIVGTALEMNDRIHTVVGVLPPVPLYPGERDVYMPTSACPTRSSEEVVEDREHRMMAVVARMRESADLAAVDEDLEALTAHLQTEHPAAYPEGSDYTASAAPLKDEIIGRARGTLWILFATVALVLLIACFNVANLMLARQLRQERELVVRTALGAGRGRLVRQLLTESTLLALMGGGLGLALAHAGLPLLLRLTDGYLPRAGEVEIDTPVLLFTLVVSLATGLFFGALPALASRRELAAALRSDSGHTSESTARRRTRHLLIVGQVAVSFVLLVVAGLLVRSLVELQRVDPGFEPERVLSMMVSPNWSRYPDDKPELRRELFETLLGRTVALPGVRSAAVASTFPLNDGGPDDLPFEIEGHPRAEGEFLPRTDWNVVSRDYFRTLGIPVLRGRGFTAQDRAGAPRVAMVNQAFARRYLREGDPVGRRLLVEDDGEPRPFTVVGVVRDSRRGLAREVAPELYFPFEQHPEYVWRVLVRTREDPARWIHEIRSLIWGIDPEQAVTQERTLVDVRRSQLAVPRRTALLLGLFALLALAITASGLGGVIAFSVGQRSYEIGIRMALGAARRRVLSLVLGQGLRLVVFGLFLGAGAALLAAPPLAELLFGVAPHDGLTFATVALVLTAVAGLACWVPAQRATRIHPMTALRTD